MFCFHFLWFCITFGTMPQNTESIFFFFFHPSIFIFISSCNSEWLSGFSEWMLILQRCSGIAREIFVYFRMRTGNAVKMFWDEAVSNLIKLENWKPFGSHTIHYQVMALLVRLLRLFKIMFDPLAKIYELLNNTVTAIANKRQWRRRWNGHQPSRIQE